MKNLQWSFIFVIIVVLCFSWIITIAYCNNDKASNKNLNSKLSSKPNQINLSNLHSAEWNYYYTQIMVLDNIKIKPKIKGKFIDRLTINESQQNQNSTKISIENPNHDQAKITTKLLLINLIVLYLNSFVIFSILTVFKYFEEINIIKKIYIDSRFRSFFDITDKIGFSRIANLNHRNVYSIGMIEVESPPVDNIFNDFFVKEDSVALSRIVVICDTENGNEYEFNIKDLDNSSKFKTDLLNNTNIYVLNHNDKNKINVEFPKNIKPSFFTSVSSLNNVRLSEHQLKRLYSKRNIKLVDKSLIEEKISDFIKEHNCNSVTLGNNCVMIQSVTHPKYVAKVYLESVRLI